jgi:hypothetical protein
VNSSSPPNPFAAARPNFFSSSRGAHNSLSRPSGGPSHSSPGCTSQPNAVSATPCTSSNITRPSADSSDRTGASEGLSHIAE